MKIKKICLTLLVVASVAIFAVRAASISSTIASINADAQKEGGPEQVLRSISASTHVPVATLEKEKAKSGLSYGDLYVAHAIANASGKSFDQIAALRTKGESWDKIADENNVSLGGKKKAAAKNVAGTATASPTPEERSMRQQQADRWAGRTEITNVRKPKPSPTPH